jgi:hypothetical protein
MLGLAHQLENGAGHTRPWRPALLHEDVAVVTVLEGMQHQVDSVRQGHHEAGHGGISHRNGLAREDLLNEERHGTTRSHDVAITSTADDSVVPSRLRLAATMTFSISALLMPMALIGYTLSVLRQTTRFTASPRGQFSVPSTLVRTAHRMKLAGRNCFSAAA